MNLIFSHIYESHKKNGFLEHEILEAEKRLKIKFPKVFKLMYLEYGRNKLINSCHYFKKPIHLKFYNSDWLEFYIENQGVCFWAINKKDFNKKNLKVYVKLEGIGYIEEAQTLDDFLIIRSLDYAHLLFPFRIWSKETVTIHENKIYKRFGLPKSDLYVEGHFHRKIFWTSLDEIICINHSSSGEMFILVFSKNANSISNFQELLPDVNWTVEPDRTSEKDDFVSFLEKEEKLSGSNNSSNKSDDTLNEDFDLPF